MRNLGACLATTVTALGVLVVTVPASGAAPFPSTGAAATPQRWTAQLAPPSDPYGRFDDVSCSSAGFCMAVGRADVVGDLQHLSGRAAPLVETRTRSGWHRASTAGLSPSIHELYKIACSSRRMCIAIPHRLHRGTMQPVRWTGSKWVTSTLPHPALDHPVNVDCATASSCMVVGTHGDLAWSWHWNGSHWASVPTPHKLVRFYGVSCPAARTCFAVGRRIAHHGPKDRAVVSRWVGRGWSLHDLPNGAPGSLADIDCLSASSCTAVGGNGSFDTSSVTGHGHVLVETLRRGAWRGLHPRMPWPDGTRSTVVSCRTRMLCSAVIDSCCSRSGYHRWTVASRAPGGRWHARRTTLLDPPLTGLACRSVTCIVVGGGPTDPVPYAFRVRGVKPLPEQVPLPPSPAGGVISGMSCTPRGFCAATTDGQPWPIVHRPGQRWRRATGYGDHHPTMADASCVSAKFCMAAGADGFERWDGTNWTFVPEPADHSHTSPYAVSCVTPTWCDAVAIGVLPKQNWIEHWDGSAWQVVLPRPTTATLWDIACTSTSACLAIGQHPERWDGSVWRPVAETGLPAHNSLGSVSCLSATNCLVNYYSRSGPGVARWDGTSFHRMALAPVHGLVIRAVTCRSAVACVAVGTSGGGSGERQAVVEAWDGHAWQLLAGPKITSSHLFAVDCGAKHCWAGGAQARGPRLPAYPIIAFIG